jgi:predicted transcriptional regulator
MSEAAIKQYIESAPFKKVLALENLLANRRQAEREKAEVDAAIANGLADVKAGKVTSSDKVQKGLRAYIAKLEKTKCQTSK